jgi:hypothetical protein
VSKVPNQHSVFGARAAFPATCWTRLADTDRREALRAEVYQQYWDPLYCYARRKGFAHEDAKDFTQGFLTEILLGREFLSRADRTRGRFRSLLVKAFQNHIGNRLRKKHAVTGVEGDVSEYQIPDEVPGDPAAAFDYVWASRVLDGVLTDLESECRRDGLESHWGLFQERVVKPLLGGQPALGMEELCRRYAVASEAQASNMVVTVKRRFRRILERSLIRPGGPHSDAGEALGDFLGIFSQAHRA